MYQNWWHLAFLHWPVPADAVRALLPPGLELDTFEGTAYAGLIPFTITGVRPRFFPALPWLSSTHEVNVRTYVHVGGKDPGVWFFSLDATNPFAVWMARAAFGLAYYHAKISLAEEPSPAGAGFGPTIAYRSERSGRGPRPASCALRYRPTGPEAPAPVGTLEHFLVERYILYSYANETLYRGRIHHRPYPLQPAEAPELQEDLLAASRLTRPDTPPLVHYARGVHVEVFPLERVRDDG